MRTMRSSHPRFLAEAPQVAETREETIGGPGGVWGVWGGAPAPPASARLSIHHPLFPQQSAFHPHPVMRKPEQEQTGVADTRSSRS